MIVTGRSSSTAAGSGPGSGSGEAARHWSKFFHGSTAVRRYSASRVLMVSTRAGMPDARLRCSHGSAVMLYLGEAEAEAEGEREGEARTARP